MKGAPELHSLTRSTAKERAYSVDTYFREGFLDWRGRTNELFDTALVILKPDAVVAHRLTPCLSLFAEAQLMPVAVTTFSFCRYSIRELWRFQLNTATIARIAVIDRFLEAAPSMALLLQSRKATPRAIPASVLVSMMKGAAEPSRRNAGDLRHRLRAGPTLFNFLHTADEPADVVRELAVLFDGAARGKLISQATCGKDASPEAFREAGRLENSVSFHDLDFESSLRRLANSIGRLAKGPYETLKALLDNAVSRRGDSALDLLHNVERSGIKYDIWDLMSVVVPLIENDLPGAEPIVPTVTKANWS